MDGHHFSSGSLMHGLSLLICGGCALLYGLVAVRASTSENRRRLTRFIATGCLLVWLGNTVFWMWPSRFLWEQALPLQCCNMANLIGAAAVWWRDRRFQALLYFWALALCVWAFLTPTVRMGPLHLQFWVFWIYHGFIPLSLTHVMVVDRYRPSGGDLRWVMGVTAVYTTVLVVVYNLWGWNYGFVGPSAPKSSTLIDALGPYPLRLIWIVGLAAALFALCYLPWWLVERRRGSWRR